jgi:hypothetical protein
MGFEGAGLEAPQPALSEWPVEALGEGQNPQTPADAARTNRFFMLRFEPLVRSDGIHSLREVELFR